MLISRMNAISQNPSMLITRGFDCIRENMFMFPFSKPTAFRISYTAFLCFDTGRNFF